jgi:hypothetical protein
MLSPDSAIAVTHGNHRSSGSRLSPPTLNFADRSVDLSDGAAGTMDSEPGSRITRLITSYDPTVHANAWGMPLWIL